MRKSLIVVPGVLLCCILALAGQALAPRLGLSVPGPVIGLGLYLAWLLWGRGIGWSRPGADLLLRWLGALIVPALVGVADVVREPGVATLKILLIIAVTTPLTALATALAWRFLSQKKDT
ncbi:CidA/LrgA family protein [Sandarakinorhabdus sp.]|uniref:CidA/LrgA family protein n=1 Tax=Sandarakinorhabdus sp. TaxID=1916663 RepID=UPI00286DBE1F|nr:CidA/LrgA family protein [Sandarakinorhabdus sp.]